MKTGVFEMEWNQRDRNEHSHEIWIFILIQGVVLALELAMLRHYQPLQGFFQSLLRFLYLTLKEQCVWYQPNYIDLCDKCRGKRDGTVDYGHILIFFQRTMHFENKIEICHLKTTVFQTLKISLPLSFSLSLHPFSLHH